jgi:RNA:NAD 2'-phosphotransferase (TPT1/KptA family)
VLQTHSTKPSAVLMFLGVLAVSIVLDQTAFFTVFSEKNPKHQRRLGPRISAILRWLKDTSVATKCAVDLKNGLLPLDVLVVQLQQDGFAVTEAEILEIVETSDKGRYWVTRIDGWLHIGATQGHSCEVFSIDRDQLYTRVADSTVVGPCFHATFQKNVSAILDGGLSKMDRGEVHLQRYKDPHPRKKADVILDVDITRMIADGLPVWLAKNGVVLVDDVPPKYITVKKNE